MLADTVFKLMLVRVFLILGERILQPTNWTKVHTLALVILQMLDRLNKDLQMKILGVWRIDDYAVKLHLYFSIVSSMTFCSAGDISNSLYKSSSVHSP